MKGFIRRIAVLAVLMMIVFTGCGRKKAYHKEFYTLFETISSLTVYADSEEDFEKTAKFFEEELKKYHQLFDIYNDYEGMNNLKTVNDYAGIKPVIVDQEIIEFLKFSRDMYEQTDGEVNIAFGSVLSIWHDYREAGMEKPDEAKLPPIEHLKAAAAHTDIENMVIDEKNSTVYLKDSKMSLDVGAIAKGYAVERIADAMEKNGVTNALIDVGGNIKAIGKKAEGGLWRLGLQNPDLKSDAYYLYTIGLDKSSLVTSGDYQRYYVVDGHRYHHIIKPDTLMPYEAYHAVSVICDDSGVADGLSTAIFNMTVEDGIALAKKFGAQVLWVKNDGTQEMTDGFKAYISE